MSDDVRGDAMSTQVVPSTPHIAGSFVSWVIRFLMVVCISPAARAEQVYQYVSFVPPPSYDSFQIRHVAITALMHVLTLGCWPKSYGNDMHQVAPYQNGWTIDQLIMLTPHAQQAYLGWVDVWSIALVLLIGAFGISALRGRVRASRRDSTREGA